MARNNPRRRRATNGREGVQLLAAQPDEFDAVLMDIQMPVLDGYAATREIRGDARFGTLPIIAMTANAMAGDKDKTLAAGMNDHVAKPIDVNELFQVLKQWISVPEQRRAAHAGPIPTPRAELDPDAATGTALDLPGIDTAAGIARVGGNTALYLKILRKFLKSQTDAVGRIRTSRGSGDLSTAEREAHTLKGLAGNIGARALYLAAEQVERLLRAGEPVDAIIPSLTELQSELTTVIAALSRLDEHGDEASGNARDRSRVPALLAELRELLEDDDTGAEEPLELLIPLLAGSPQASLLKELADHVDSYDFEAALEVLRRLAVSF